MANNELKPCPFCGGKAVEDRDCAGFHNYRCTKCKCSLYGDYEHHMTGRAAWNRRAAPAQAEPSGALPEGFQRLETVKFWADAFADDPQRVAGAMISKLLNEYAQLRESRILGQQGGGDAADAARYRFMMQWQDTDSQPQAIIDMWRKVYAEHRLKPTREDYETAIDAAIAAIQAQAGDAPTGGNRG